MNAPKRLLTSCPHCYSSHSTRLTPYADKPQLEVSNRPVSGWIKLFALLGGLSSLAGIASDIVQFWTVWWQLPVVVLASALNNLFWVVVFVGCAGVWFHARQNPAEQIVLHHCRHCQFVYAQGKESLSSGDYSPHAQAILDTLDGWYGHIHQHLDVSQKDTYYQTQSVGVGMGKGMFGAGVSQSTTRKVTQTVWKTAALKADAVILHQNDTLSVCDGNETHIVFSPKITGKFRLTPSGFVFFKRWQGVPC